MLVIVVWFYVVLLYSLKSSLKIVNFLYIKHVQHTITLLNDNKPNQRDSLQSWLVSQNPTPLELFRELFGEKKLHSLSV